MALYVQDDGDKYDSMKWDFPEDNNNLIIIGKYPYKTRSKENAEILNVFRKQIDKLCMNIENNRNQWEYTTNNQEYLDGVDIFLGLHNEYYYDPYELPEPFHSIAMKGHKTSRYLLSEIPPKTKFAGLNKPKARYRDLKAPPVGKDSNGRALYRDIFLDLHNNTSNKLKALIIHELAHSMANHIQWRPDDHHADFKFAEDLIKQYWPS